MVTSSNNCNSKFVETFGTPCTPNFTAFLAHNFGSDVLTALIFSFESIHKLFKARGFLAEAGAVKMAVLALSCKTMSWSKKPNV